ncbi:MAG: peptidylprolyl isomerase [Candidatus Limnocylindrales bacterium]
MTLRAKPVTTKKRRSVWESDRRQQLIVTVGFIAIIVLALLILVGAVGAAYYNDHLKSIANVNGTSISVDQYQARIKVLDYRLNVGEQRPREAVAAGTLDKDTAQQQLSQLEQARQSEQNSAIQGLMDDALIRQLAGPLGVSVTPAEVDAEIQNDAGAPEQRHAVVMTFEPDTDKTTGLPSDAQKAAALAKAQQAVAEIKGGKAFADVAKDLAQEPTGGDDFGFITTDDTSDDPTIVAAIFALPGKGTTDVVTGQDGFYRVGEVTEVRPATNDPSFMSDMRAAVNESAYRDGVEGSLIRQKVSQKLVAQQLQGPVDQVHAYEILVAITDPSGQGSTAAALEDEVQVSHILYSPKGDAQGATTLDAADPAWAEAEKKADAAAAALRAISDVTAREKAFAARATAESNDTGSASSGGDLGFQQRSTFVAEFSAAIFDGQHTKGEIIGPVKTQYGYHVILWEALKESPSKRINTVSNAVRQSGASFQDIAKTQSDGTEASDGGDLGWFAKGQASDYRIEQTLFGLQPGGISLSLQLTDGYHLYKVEARQSRPAYGAQVAQIRANAFSDWYSPQKQALQDGGKITTDPSLSSVLLGQ